MFDIKINVIMSNCKTLNHKLALANAIFRKTFGLTLKGKHVRTGSHTTFELHLMDCFTYVNGGLALKLPSGKLRKSYLNPPVYVPETMPVLIVPPEIKPLAPMYHLPCIMDSIKHPEDDEDLSTPLLTRRP